jgi:DNA-binding transcriptional LysR family regulator
MAAESGVRATSLSTLAQMVAGGAGATLLPRLALASENRHGRRKLAAEMRTSLSTLLDVADPRVPVDTPRAAKQRASDP